MTATVFTPPSGPRGVIRPGDAGSALLGAFGEAPIARIDHGGALQRLDSDWVLDFWIAAEDRLHTPASDSAVRQSRLGPGPVIRTAARVPGGDIVQRAWVAPLAQGSGVVVEFENETATPVGLTLTIRPFDLAGAPSKPDVRISSDRIQVNDTTMWLSAEHRDTIPELDAVVIPLPHGATVRVILVGADDAFSPDRPIPSSDDAVRGWDALLTATCRITLPDDGMTALFNNSRGRLSLATHDLAARVATARPNAGDELVALGHGGMERDAVEVLRSLLADLWTPPRLPRGADPGHHAAVLDGIAWTAALFAPQWAEEFLPAGIQIARSVAKRSSGSERDRAHAALARLTMTAGDAEAARSIDESFGLHPTTSTDVGAIAADAEHASESGAFGHDDAGPPARLLSLLRSQLVRESWDEQPTVDLFPGFPSSWRGGSIELHAIPTIFGPVSAAIRWHGYRPALLWDFERAPEVVRPVTIRCTTLDPDWSTTDRTGEALRAGAAEGLGDAPTEGQSFS